MKKYIVFITLLLGACSTSAASGPVATPTVVSTSSTAVVAPLESQPLANAEDVLAKLIPDALFAKALADSHGDVLASNCHAAVAALAQSQLTQLRALPTTLPNPHFITTFQIGRDVTKLTSGGIPQPLAIGCAALAQDVRLDVLTLMNKMIGQAGVAALTGGLAIPIP